MKLRYYLKDKIKVYTLKSEINSVPTLDAHYKFIKIKLNQPIASEQSPL